MPDLIIDGRPIGVPKGTMVIEAAERLGIVIPRFCWHPALGAAGACRMCAVMFTDGPVKGLEMSCMTPAADGMVVETFHPKAVAFRRRIIELLMANHPHDCPVCDEGGNCLLQDETISGGHALRRFPGRKRTYQDQDLGPFIQHEMNRCIHCYRCARFYQDYCGYHDFGPMQNANRVYFGRFANGPLENPFSGNLADLCPTGTLTDKTARYKSRRWDCQRAPSVCPHCSLGCNTVVLSRYRAVTRIEARENAAVNGFFLCDRGRFSHGFSPSHDRPRQARLDGTPTPMATACREAANRLAAIATAHGPKAVAVAGSRRSTLETQATLTALATAAGWSGPAFFTSRAEQTATTKSLAALTPGRVRSLAELERADAIVCLGISPLADAPLLALALRQATRSEGSVFVADPRPVALPLPFIHLAAAPHQLPTVAGLLTAPLDQLAARVQKELPLAPPLWPQLEQAARALAAAKRPVLVFAPWLVETLPADERFGLFPILSGGANAAGAALAAPADAPSLDDLAAGIEAGTIKGLLAVETDFATTSPRLAAALGRLETLVVCDHLPTPTVASAQVFLPTTTLFETDGTSLNNEGRAQTVAAVQAPGDPVSRDGAGSHPPRDYARQLPGTDPCPAASLCVDLARELAVTLPSAPLAALPVVIPAGPDPQGSRVAFSTLAGDSLPTLPLPSAPTADTLAVVFTDTLFGTEELGRYAPLAINQAAMPVITLHTTDAARCGLADGDRVVLAAGLCRAEIPVHVTDGMAQGVIVVPRLPIFAGLPESLASSDLQRKEADHA